MSRSRPNTASRPFPRTSAFFGWSIAKLRWRTERDYQELKQEVGLGDFEGRGWMLCEAVKLHEGKRLESAIREARAIAMPVSRGAPECRVGLGPPACSAQARSVGFFLNLASNAAAFSGELTTDNAGVEVGAVVEEPGEVSCFAAVISDESSTESPAPSENAIKARCELGVALQRMERLEAANATLRVSPESQI
jgi:hypothetical protein